MKKTLSSLLVFICVSVSACFGQGADDVGPVLDKFNIALNAKLSEINAQVKSASAEIAGVISDEAKVRKILSDLCIANQPYVIDVALVDYDGRMVIIEPDKYRKFEGTHIAVQKEAGMAFSSKRPVFSNVFRAVEGMDAVSFQFPVLSPTGKHLGWLSILLKPYELLKLVVAPVIKDTDVDIWVMQKNGLMLFDSDEKEIGKNVFSDDYYKPHHSFLSICQRISSRNSGAGEYEFFATGTDTLVKKRAVWNTVDMHGTVWRVVYYEVVE